MSAWDESSEEIIEENEQRNTNTISKSEEISLEYEIKEEESLKKYTIEEDILVDNIIKSNNVIDSKTNMVKDINNSIDFQNKKISENEKISKIDNSEEINLKTNDIYEDLNRESNIINESKNELESSMINEKSNDNENKKKDDELKISKSNKRKKKSLKNFMDQNRRNEEKTKIIDNDYKFIDKNHIKTDKVENNNEVIEDESKSFDIDNKFELDNKTKINFEKLTIKKHEKMKNSKSSSQILLPSSVTTSLKQSFDQKINESNTLNNFYNNIKNKISGDTFRDIFHKSASSTQSMLNSGMKIVDNLLNTEKQDIKSSSCRTLVDTHKMNQNHDNPSIKKTRSQKSSNNNSFEQSHENSSYNDMKNIDKILDFSKLTFSSKFDHLHGVDIVNYLSTANQLWSMSQKTYLDTLKNKGLAKSLFIAYNNSSNIKNSIDQDFNDFDDTMDFETNYSNAPPRSMEYFKAIFHEFCDILMINIDIETWFDDWYNFERLITFTKTHHSNDLPPLLRSNQNIHPYEIFLNNLALFVIIQAKFIRCLCDNFMLHNPQLSNVSNQDPSSLSSMKNNNRKLQFKQIEIYLQKMFQSSNDVMRFLGHQCYLMLDDTWANVSLCQNDLKTIHTQILFEIYNARAKILEIYKLVEPFVIIYR